ncbi:hypothetical protein JCM30204_47320 [Dysgonomonas termitidis]
MKTIFLSIILAVLFSVTNLYAGEPEPKIFTNVEPTGWGTLKEYTYFDDSGLKAVKKEVCSYDKSDKLFNKTIYKWDGDSGWTNFQQYTYEYNDNGLVAKIVRADWNKKSKSWSANVKEFIHTYNSAGELIAIK